MQGFCFVLVQRKVHTKNILKLNTENKASRSQKFLSHSFNYQFDKAIMCELIKRFCTEAGIFVTKKQLYIHNSFSYNLN
jgi:hypothetical protein